MDVGWRALPGRGHLSKDLKEWGECEYLCMCKGPEAGAGLAGVRKSKQASVAGAERMQGRVVGDEGRETGRSRARRALQTIVATLAFVPSEMEPLEGLERSSART